jgi:hypothetical protein
MITNKLKHYLNPVFIETGSYIGEGIMAAKKAGFQRIFSIELSDHYYNICKEKFGKERNIYLHHGDTINVLPKLLKIINEHITFWLDAHWCGDVSACGPQAVPLMDELLAIKEHPIKIHTILIDDMRLLRTHDAEWKDLKYGIKELENMVLSINPEYKITYIKGLISQDILVAQV